MKLREALQLIIGTTLIVSCSQTDLKSGNADAPKSEAETADITEDTSLANEPVSVAGAFLMCQYEGSESQGIHTVGCDIRNQDQRSLSDLGDVSFTWNREASIPSIIRLGPLPYKLTLTSIQLDTRTAFIEATLNLPARTLAVKLDIGSIEGLPSTQVLSGFAANILLVRSWPENGAEGPIVLIDGRCITSTEINFSGGQKVQVQPCVASNPFQQFVFSTAADGTSFNIQKAGEEECMDIPIDDGLEVLSVNTFRSCHEDSNQMFRFTERNGFFSMSATPVTGQCFYATGSDILLQPCYSTTQ
ncbi:ricin-type beta-trefoil lectin domain protein [Pseudobacteriovorax antillogorgiicola]|nr:ricin-type beta-trefoil lectin domain protein [Pseudobacteriovorax antillogorgiicola]